MISFDTNVWVRLLTNDDPEQVQLARECIRNAERIFIAKTTLLELEWVLRHSYRLSPGQILIGFQSLLGLDPCEVEDRARVLDALEWYSAGLDFADALHLASSSRASVFATFDRRLVKDSARCFTIPRVEPVSTEPIE